MRWMADPMHILMLRENSCYQNQGDSANSSLTMESICMCVSVGTAVSAHMICVHVFSNGSHRPKSVLCAAPNQRSNTGSLRTKGLLEWSVSSCISNIQMSFRNTFLILGFCIFVHAICINILFSPQTMCLQILSIVCLFSQCWLTFFTPLESNARLVRKNWHKTSDFRTWFHKEAKDGSQVQEQCMFITAAESPPYFFMNLTRDP